MTRAGTLHLVVRQTIPAPAERLFEAWTTPSQLEAWWGPRGARCRQAQIDLRVGGQYRLVNEFEDGRQVVIEGEFVAIEPPRRLVYTWRLESSAPTAEAEQVTVRFEPRGAGTEVIVEHQRITNQEIQDGHEAGWRACLAGLAIYADGAQIFGAAPE